MGIDQSLHEKIHNTPIECVCGYKTQGVDKVAMKEIQQHRITCKLFAKYYKTFTNATEDCTKT